MYGSAFKRTPDWLLDTDIQRKKQLIIIFSYSFFLSVHPILQRIHEEKTESKQKKVNYYHSLRNTIKIIERVHEVLVLILYTCMCKIILHTGLHSNLVGKDNFGLSLHHYPFERASSLGCCQAACLSIHSSHMR